MASSRSGSKSLSGRMEHLSAAVTEWTGTTNAFMLALGAVVVWLLTGPLFHYSDTWQLVINTATTVITFLMVFLIQRAQNKSARAVALKLNELIAAVEGASSRLIDTEQMSEAELDHLQEYYREMVRMAKKEGTLTRSHSIEEARVRHEVKKRHRGTSRAATA